MPRKTALATLEKKLAADRAAILNSAEIRLPNQELASRVGLLTPDHATGGHGNLVAPDRRRRTS